MIAVWLDFMVAVGSCSWPAVVVKCGDDPFVGFFMYYFIVVEILFYCNDYIILL